MGPRLSRPLFFYGIVAAVCYLILDGYVGALLDHIPFTVSLLSQDDPQEWWMRGITIGIILAFGWISEQMLRRQSELTRALERSRRELHLLIESASEGILFLDPDKRVRLVNPAFCHLTGYSQEELQQGDLHKMLRPRLREDDDPSVPCPLCGSLDRGAEERCHIPRLLINHARGSTVTVECWIHAVFSSEERRFEGWLATLIDIGRRVAAEEKNRQLLEDLQREERRLSARNEELQRFAYVASHDLQEPLRMVSSFVQLLKRRYGDQLDDSAREFIGFAVDGTERMQKMINSLLEYSRIGSQGGDLKPRPLTPLIEAAVSNLQVMIRECGATIHLPSSDTVILADDSQMIRLFQNLISNAIKFQPDGQNAVVTVSVEEQGDLCHIRIKDNGIGIPPAYRAKVFEVFKRLHSHDKYEGSGIGLAVCRRIAARHNGTLEIADQPENEKGTTFVITLPRSISHKNEQPSTNQPASSTTIIT